MRDIHVQGLQRISEGTVFNYLPVNIGDRLNPQRVREALRALYATGFFSDVELRREGNTLLVVVKERPSIESIDFKGNKDIKTEDLNKALRNVGLSAGKTFDRSTLDDVTQYLTDQYYSRGKYDVKIDAKVVTLPDNRVRISINITEGARAKIRQIDIVGNTVFKDKEILSTLSLQTPTLLNMFSEQGPLRARVAAGRSGEDPGLFPGPRLRQCAHRFGAGGDRSGQEGHLHHRQPHAGGSLSSRRR